MFVWVKFLPGELGELLKVAVIPHLGTVCTVASVSGLTLSIAPDMSGLDVTSAEAFASASCCLIAFNKMELRVCKDMLQ